MSQYIVYVLVNNRGNMIKTDHKLPFYWNKKVADSDAILFKATVKKVKMWKLKDLF